jgi:hypothetical protein
VRLSFGSFVFDSRLRAVTRDGARVDLSPKAFLLLESLNEARPAPVPKEVLYARLWPKTFVEAGNLHNLVAEIRRALEDRERRVVRTVHGTGYCFDPRDGEAPLAASRLLLWIGEEVVHLRPGECVIGRDPDATIVISSPDVSRRHARLFVADENVVIEDLGSKNGTFVDGERLSAPTAVRPPVELTIGKTRVLLRARGGVQSTLTSA